MAKEITCYGQTIGNGWAQEVYETASRDAGTRTRELRKAGYRTVTSAMGEQVTGVGRVKLTMVTIFNPDENLPAVKIERI